MNLTGKKVLLTGGVRGLGRATVEKLVAKGATVCVFDIDTTGLTELAQQVPGVGAIQCDVSSADDVARAMGQYHEQYRCADVLVNNAGILSSAPLVRITPTGIETHDINLWNKTLAINLTSVFLMTSAVVSRMVTTRTRGVIVNISSVSAGGNAGQSAYSAAKAGVNALTATWAKELSLLGIRVIAIAPGFTETESTKQAVSEQVLKETISRVPLRRLGRAEEIAQAVVAAVENDFFNGKTWAVDGGLVI